MRGEASRIADRESRDLLASKLRDTREDAWRIGNELFVITSLLDGNVRIERALTDVSRPLEDKVAVLNTLLGDQVHPMTMEIMTEVVKRRWSRAADIANAVEDFMFSSGKGHRCIKPSGWLSCLADGANERAARRRTGEGGISGY